MLRGLLTLILFQGIGEVTVYLSGLPIPGAVIGMLLLFIALQVRPGTLPNWLGEAGHFMIRWLSLLFVPACVGLFFLPEMPPRQWLAVVSVIVFATLITMVATALVMKWLINQFGPPGMAEND